MLFVIQVLLRFFRNPAIERAKPFTLHCSLLFVVLGYSFLGGFIFDHIETNAHAEFKKVDRANKSRCVAKILEAQNAETFNLSDQASLSSRIADCFESERDERSEWSFVTATLYGFGIVTTLGYNRIAPITFAGRMFCILYGICGIPFTMIIIANVGQYLNNFAGDSRRKIEEYRQQRRMSKASLSGKVYKESSIQVTSLVLLSVFLVYVAIGALLLPALNGELDFFNGLYFNFLCLTAIDFGQLVPIRVEFLPITFLYVCIGLAITTIAINIGSEYMKKLHYWGKKMKNAAQTKIWFGGKTLRVKDLLHAVGKKCGVEPSVIDGLDLEEVVEQTIAIQEGRAVEEDINGNVEERKPKISTISECSSYQQQPPSPKTENPLICYTEPLEPVPTPEIIVKKPTYQTLPSENDCFSVQVRAYDTFNSCQLEVKTEDEPKWAGAIIVEPPTARDDMIIQENPLERDDSSSSINKDIPKRFQEKKQKYGRDPRKLYETYQEEWDRLERLSDKRGGSRRKSVMNLSSYSPERSGSISPLPRGEDDQRRHS